MKNKKYKQIVKFIIEYIEKNFETQQIHKKRGRPTVYHTKLILTALILKTFLKLSFRDTQDLLEDLFPNKPIPDFSTLFYRFKKLDKQLVEDIIKDLAEIIRQKIQVKEFHCMIADGTGFGYSDTYKLRWKRGKQIREVSAHIKVEVVIGVVRNKKVVLGVKTDRAYSCERKLLSEILKDIPFRAFYFLGDAYYGIEVGILREIKRMGMVAVVPVRDSLHMKVKSQERLWAKEKYEKRKELYKRNRYKIEQLIGYVKNIMDDRDNTRIYELASLYVLARFAVYNFLVLWDLYLFFDVLVIVIRNQVILILLDFSNSLYKHLTF